MSINRSMSRYLTSSRKLLCLLALAQVVTTPFAALAFTPMQDAERLMQEERYKDAFAIIDELARHGDANASFKLGLMYENGLGVERDLHQARQAYNDAAQMGHDEAKLALARMALNGSGGPVDRDLATEVLSKLAQNPPEGLKVQVARMLLDLGGDPANVQRAVEMLSQRAADADIDALHVLANIYEEGKSVPKDIRKALEYYELAANTGDPKSMLDYAERLTFPIADEAKLSKAATWIKEAAELGLAEAQYQYGEVLESGRGVPKQIDQAVVWYERALASGHQEARMALANLLLAPPPQEKNIDHALELLTEAAETGNVEAMLKLAELFDGGLARGSNQETALAWLLRAANSQEEAWLAESIAERYLSGKGAPVNVPQAVLWYEKAASVGSAEAHASLGEIYAEGSGGIAEDQQKATEQFGLAAKAGSVWAMTEYGRRLLDGTGVQADWVAAVRWLEEASAKGDKTAPMLWLGALSQGAVTASESANALSDMHAGTTGHPDRFADGQALLDAGTLPEKQKAIDAIRRLAELGDPAAQFSLASVYYHGEGVEKDLAVAYFWWALSARSDNSFATIRQKQVATELDNAARRQLDAEVKEWRPLTQTRTGDNRKERR